MNREKAFIERDLSLVKFNKRVAEEAYNNSLPILERFKFLSIYLSNMQEFYQIRVGSKFDDLNAIIAEGKNGHSLIKELEDIYDEVVKTDKYVAEVYDKLVNDFSGFGFNIKNVKDAEKDQYSKLKEYFKQNIIPLLSPIVVTKSDLFIHLETGKVALIVAFEVSSDAPNLYGVCELPLEIEKALLVKEKDKMAVYLIEDMMLCFAAKVFDGFKIKKASLVKITRNADIDIDEARKQADDYRNMLSLLLNRRKSLLPVRIEYKGQFKGELRKFIIKRIRLQGDHVTESRVPLDFSFVKSIKNFIHFAGIMTKASSKGIESKIYKPVEDLEQATSKSILVLAKEKDLFFNYPYNSMSQFLRFLEEAASDRNVCEIKMTLYRVSDNSKIVDILCKAAQKKKVTVIIELKARFDERNNIDISRQLQEAGCDVFFGLEGFKVHSKLVTVSFKNGDRLTFIGTGNFHEVTSKLYTDLGVLTSDKIVAEDADNFFIEVSNTEKHFKYKKLMVTPDHFKYQLIDLINIEIEKALRGKRALIIMKCNALTHPEIIDKLVEASRLGVTIKLIVRGACSIVPGIKNYTESLTVRSIVGEFLEHSRIYMFGYGAQKRIFISSADIMKRNLDHRYEIAYEVEDRTLKQKLKDMLNIYLKDNVKARECNNLGEYHFVERKENERRIFAQEYFKRQVVRENRKFKKGKNNN